MKTPSNDTALTPNHHAEHPGFAGASGLLAGVMFLFGRDRAARLAIELSGLRPDERLVDVGCGPGTAVHHARAHGARVIGVDPSSEMLRVARTRWRAHPSVEWRLGTAEAIPAADLSTDVVWSLATVHHWADVDAALREVRRVLVPGGRLLVLERRITDTTAAGAASHGWVPEQADSFAASCRCHGFDDVAVSTHPGKRTPILAVVARLPDSDTSDVG